MTLSSESSGKVVAALRAALLENKRLKQQNENLLDDLA
ncbi:polyketide synthase docking domain-containing protein, partial [Micromonospora qiuiae]